MVPCVAVTGIPLERAARVAEAAARRARAETLPRFRSVDVETKSDGSPVTEADRAAERAIRSELRAAFPEFGVTGEEYGDEGPEDAPRWIIDPIDGTVAFSRGIPLFTTLIALLDEDEPVVGVIDCPTLDECYVGFEGGGCRRNGTPVRVSQAADLSQALISHGDPIAFARFGEMPAFERMARELPWLRGYTDAFGHAQVLSGGVDAMVDLELSPWDCAATRILVPEAGGRCELLEERRGKRGLVIGAPALVEHLLAFLSTNESSTEGQP